LRSLQLLVIALLLAVLTWLGFELTAPERAVRSAPEDERDDVPELAVEAPRAVTPATPEPATGASAAELARTRNKRALDALERGELRLAIDLLEQCTELDPNEQVFVHNLAEALARLAVREHEAEEPQRRAAALETLARARRLHPERADLERVLARWQKSADTEKDFWRKQTEHFELSFDGTRDELMWGTAPLENELESAYHEYGELFGFFPVEQGRPRVRVVLYRRADFDSVTGLGDWVGGVFDGTVRVPVEDLGREVPQLKRVLRHELLHAFVREAGGARVPGWLNEGLAQWLESVAPGDRQRTVANAEAELRGHALFSLDELRGSLTHLRGDQVALAYAQSVGFVGFIERTYGERVLFEMVSGCRDDKTPSETFRERIGIELGLVLDDFAQGL